MKDINKKFTSSAIYVKDLFTDIFKMFYTIIKYGLLIVIGFFVLIVLPLLLFSLLPEPLDYIVTVIWTFAVGMTIIEKV